MTAPPPAVRRAALVLLLLAGLSLAVLSLAGSWQEVRSGAGELSVAGVAAAGACVLLGLWCSLLSWRSTVAGLGVAVPLPTAARVFFVGQLGKYVPGSVWPVLAQMELGAAHGLSRRVIGTASLLTLAIGVPVALSLGLLAGPALLSAGASGYLWLFLVLPPAGAVLAPRVLNPLLDRALRLLRRPSLPIPLTSGAVLQVAGWAAAAHVLLGVSTWVLARDLGAQGELLLPLAVGAYCLASVAGLLALPVPAGAGVREAVLVLTLSTVLPPGESLLLALVSRAILTGGDLLTAGAAAHGVRATSSSTAGLDADDQGRTAAS